MARFNTTGGHTYLRFNDSAGSDSTLIAESPSAIGGTATYGSLFIDSGASSSYEGFSIGGRAVFMHNNSTVMGLYDDVNSHWALYHTLNAETRLYHNGTERIRTYSGGADISGSVRADNGSSSSPSFTFNGDTDTGFYRSSTTGEIRVSSNNSEDFRFAAGGTFHADADIVAYSTTISDKRLKTKIAPLNSKDSLDVIQSLDAVEFEYKRKKGEKHFGFIAQEVKEILPEIVTENVLLKENDHEKYLTLHQEELIPHLVGSIKEQQKEINSLKDELSELKSLMKEILNK